MMRFVLSLEVKGSSIAGRCAAERVCNLEVRAGAGGVHGLTSAGLMLLRVLHTDTLAAQLQTLGLHRDENRGKYGT